MRTEAVAERPAGRAVDHLVQLPISVTGTGALMSAVWRMRAFLTPYDACYVALAEELEGDFVTGDPSLAVELHKRGKRTRYLGDV